MEVSNGDDADKQNDQDGDEDVVYMQTKKTSKLSDEQELENLKRCLNVFNAVYGPQGPRSDPTKFELNHFSRISTLPVLKPKAGLRTQGHYALYEVLLPTDNPVFSNGVKELSTRDKKRLIDQAGVTRELRPVLTEDPDFGLTFFSERERATEADMKLYYAQFNRVKDTNTYNQYVDPSPVEQELLDDLSEEERYALINSRNDEIAELITMQLQNKLFDWETPDTMSGSAVPKQSKDDPMRPGAFALSERHVWKEIRERQQILDAGGEAAARLLEKEYEDAMVEKRREERRRQNAATKETKRAAWEESIGSFGESSGMGSARGREKRVKFSGWVAEE